MRISLKFQENWRFFLCFFVHLFLLWAVFDTYFKSPLVHGMTPHGELPDDSAPAFRLVLFVADGLRAHSLFENTSRAPFLRKVMTNFGTWGVSHTHVPTESRPGHVALIAGFYEDVSAVMKGWKENPVEFDSVFNQSRSTWSWGSPDILPMFAKGSSGHHVFTQCYDSSNEDFASSDPSQLDIWVFDKVKAFFTRARDETSLSSALRQQKIVFFLHLLGLDTSGHGYKPLSSEYLSNVRIVDDGVAAVYDLVESFYGNDGRTAYVFTSDHGMTDWGSHGAGDAHETMTPLVAWGAGIPRQENSESNQLDRMDLTNSFLRTPDRKDVNQADIASLMAALLGINMPMNSVGILPLDYLNASQTFRASAACANFYQLVEQMKIQRQRKYDSSFHLFFKDFSALNPLKLNLIVGEIEKLITQKRFSAAEQLCHQWSPTVVDGLRYYHQYERRFLSFCVAMTFVFLELCVWRFASDVVSGTTSEVAPVIRPIFFFAALATAILFWIHSFPLVRYLYGLVPLSLIALSQPLWNSYFSYLWTTISSIFGNRNLSAGLLEIRRQCSTASVGRTMAYIILAIAAIELLIWSFFYRWILSLGLWLLTVWPVSVGLDKKLSLAWMAGCLITSVFPFLPTVGKSATPELIFYTSTGMGVCCVFFYVLDVHWKLAEANGRRFDRDSIVFAVLFLFIMASGCINLTTRVSIERRLGSPLLNRCGSWIILLSSTWLPLLVRRRLWTRLATLSMALFSPLTLMSVSYETLFYVCLCVLLYLWLRIEAAVEDLDSVASKRFSINSASETRSVAIDDLRRAYFFVFFIFLSFFGTGNIASVNSFDPTFTTAFVTIFSPFLMGALLLTKIAIPFFIVCSFLCGLETTTSRGVKVLFWLIVMISDGMALRFFFLLRDQGSWLEIGTTISHFVISSVITLIIMILYHFAKLFHTKTLFVVSTVEDKRHVL